MTDLSPETPAQILEHEASQDAVRSFIAWRKATKAPLTERAAARIAKSLREIAGGGGDADEALDLTQEHGWRTIKPDWYWKVSEISRPSAQLRTINGGHNGQPDRNQSSRETALEHRTMMQLWWYTHWSYLVNCRNHSKDNYSKRITPRASEFGDL